MAVLDVTLGSLHLLVILTHLFYSPYTKVEESFNLQATRDLIQYGLATSNVTASLRADYDHFAFPGSVPRTFVGPVLLAGLSRPVISVFGHLVNAQVLGSTPPPPEHDYFSHQVWRWLVRGVLGLFTALSLSLFTQSVRLAYGRTTATLYTLLQATQFHLPYYSSRPLPNTFALVLSTAALSLLLPTLTASPQRRRGRYKLGIYLLTFTTTVFRSELAILLGLLAIQLLYTRRISLTHLLSAGLTGGIVGLLVTLSVDSYFWQSQSPTTPFSTPFLTPNLGLIWPELSGFLYNAIENKSSEWGISPWHYYFTSSLPKLLLNPLFLLLIPLAIHTSPSVVRDLYLLPAIGFVTTYSTLPHKEWRFIIYVLPILTLTGAIGATWIWNRRRKSAIYALLATGICASIAVAAVGSAAMSAVSSWNYPGGEGVDRLHRMLLESPPERTKKVHLDVFACMTGATRFLQDGPLRPNGDEGGRGRYVTFDKTEDEGVLLSPVFWEDVEWVVTGDISRVIGRWKVVGGVVGWRGVKLYRPGEKVWVGEGGIGERGVNEVGVLGTKGFTTWWKQGLEGGWGARDRLFGGYWVGARMEEVLWILRKEKDGV